MLTEVTEPGSGMQAMTEVLMRQCFITRPHGVGSLAALAGDEQGVMC